MHRINYKGGDFDYIDSDRVPQLFEKLKKKQFFQVGENIRDSFDVKNVVKITKDEAMIFELLQNQNSYVDKKVREEIEKYPYELSAKVVENMILKYNN